MTHAIYDNIDTDDLGLVVSGQSIDSVALEIEYSYYPEEKPNAWYPGYPAFVEIETLNVLSANTTSGETIEITPEDEKTILNKIPDETIETLCLENKENETI